VYNVIAVWLGIRRFLLALVSQVINAEWREQKLITTDIFPPWLIALFLLLSHFFSRFTTARARLCSSGRLREYPILQLFPPQGNLPQGV